MRFCKTKTVIWPVLIAMVITATMAQFSAGEDNSDLNCRIQLSPKPNIEKSGEGPSLDTLCDLPIIDDKQDAADTDYNIRPADPIKDESPARDKMVPVNVDSAEMDSQFLGEIKKYPLCEISSQSLALELSIKLPAGMKFNHLAPFNVTMSSNIPKVIKPGKFKITKGSNKLKIPVTVNSGEAILTIDLNFSYCEIANASLCYFKNARLEIPVKIVKSGGKVFSVKYEVFE